MRIPLTFSVEDCRLIGRVIVECLATIRDGAKDVRTSPADADRSMSNMI